MNHHAFVYVGEGDEAIFEVKKFCKSQLNFTKDELIDATTLTYGQLSVKDARDAAGLIGYGSRAGSRSLYILSASRIMPEAQNALLKVIEEPPIDVCIVLVVPVLSQLLPTVLSRTVVIEARENTNELRAFTETFLNANRATRDKLLDAIMKDAKSDNDEKKERARTEARQLLNDLQVIAHKEYAKRGDTELLEFLKDLTVILPLLYDKGTSYKTILEHVKLVIPKF